MLTSGDEASRPGERSEHEGERKIHPCDPTAPTISPSTRRARAIFPGSSVDDDQRKTAMHADDRRKVYHGTAAEDLRGSLEEAGTVTERIRPQTIFTRSPR